MIKELIKRWARRSTVAASMTLAVLAPSDAISKEVGPYLGVGVLAGEAPGLDDGYVHFGGFVPLVQPTNDTLIFADGSLLLYNEGSDILGGNLGLGWRGLSYATNTILGGYVYYDRRDTEQYEFDQIGLGVESLGTLFDARLNVNVPIGQENATVDRGFGFSGNSLAAFGTSYDALTTVDGEVGALLTEREFLQLRAFVGVYGLFDSSIDDTLGVKGRLEARIADQCYVGAYITNDDEFDTTGGFTFEYRFGTKQTAGASDPRLARLSDPIQRRKHIAVVEDDTPRALTSDNAPIEFAFLNRNSTGAGTGTFEDPFISSADVATSTADVVFVEGNVILDSITINQAGQQLLSGSQSHTIVTDQGTFTVPIMGSTIVEFSRIIIAADNVTVAGFHMEYDGIRVLDVSGTVIRNNTIINGGLGIETSYDFIGEITGNTIIDTFSSSRIEIDGNVVGNITDNIIGITANGFPSGDGIRIGRNVTGNIMGNTMNDVSIGIRVDGNVTGNITGNTANSDDYMGILVGGNVTGNITDNTANNTRTGIGISVDGNVTGSITGNTANSNDFEGIFVWGDVTGSITGNTANDNGRSGIDLFIGNVAGSITGNTANDNGGSGIFLDDGNVAGDITNNTTNDNNLYGIRVDGTVGGTKAPNTTTGNGSGNNY